MNYEHISHQGDHYDYSNNFHEKECLEIDIQYSISKSLGSSRLIIALHESLPETHNILCVPHTLVETVGSRAKSGRY